MSKTYDREYFDRWYRSSRAVVRQDVVQRKVRLALAATEHLLGREVQTVLDVGCGEAPWRGILRRMRPELEYTGVDPSDYVVRRYGRSRNILQGSLLDLDDLYLERSYDLVVCADVLQYLPNDDVRRGLTLLARRTGGVAYIEAFTAGDDMVGEHEDWHMRSAEWYRRAFRQAGLVPVGLYLFVGPRLFPTTNELERCS
ncbi:MAG: class I SAM-dependent methyltransferase [Candidatus Cloacimonetes bacterium]|nr:class I SAM-dependent methyltransferase [Candidatus Cloacimonadota bacterium]